MFKRILLLLFILTSFISVTASAEDSDRWQWIYSDDFTSYYIDTKSIEYNSANNQIIFWSKNVSLQGNENLYQKVVDLDSKMQRIRYFVFYYKSTGKREELANRDNTMAPVFIDTPTPNEQEINAVCDILHLPPIWGNKNHTWKWIKSTDRVSFYVCEDAFKALPDNRVEFFIKREVPESATKYTNIGLYIADFNNKKMYYYLDGFPNKPYVINTIIPDSPEEAIYNAAAALAGKGTL